jgi:hypothetical protein
MERNLPGCRSHRALGETRGRPWSNRPNKIPERKCLAIRKVKKKKQTRQGLLKGKESRRQKPFIHLLTREKCPRNTKGKLANYKLLFFLFILRPGGGLFQQL